MLDYGLLDCLVVAVVQDLLHRELDLREIAYPHLLFLLRCLLALSFTLASSV